MTLTYFSTVISKHTLIDNGTISNVIFDNFGQILFFTCNSDIYLLLLATSSTTISNFCSAPIVLNNILLPFHDMLYSIKLPNDCIGKFALFGESSLAVSTNKGLYILPFNEKISSSSTTNSIQQFIKNPTIIKDIVNNPNINWLKMVEFTKIFGFAWSNNTLVILTNENNSNKANKIVGLTIKNEKIEILFSFSLNEKVISISISGSKLLVAFRDSLSFYHLDNPEKPISTSNLGKPIIKRVAFLNPELIAIHTLNRKLLLLYHSNIIKVFSDVFGFQETGSNSWPLLLFGEQWRLLGADNNELFLDDDLQHGIIIGVENFSLFSIAPFEFISFIHLVVIQSIKKDSLASAISILTQLSDEKREEILIKVGKNITKETFSQFINLIERFPSIEDNVFAKVLLDLTKNLTFDYNELYKNCVLKQRYHSASVLLDYTNVINAIDLIIKSKFDIFVVKNVCKKYGNVFDNEINDLDPKLKLKLDEEAMNFLRDNLIKRNFSLIAETIDVMENLICRLLLKANREKFGDEKFDLLIDAMEKCTGQQLTNLAVLFQNTFRYDLLFCAAFVLRNFTKCIECIEKQQRILRFVEPSMLYMIGYNK